MSHPNFLSSLPRKILLVHMAAALGLSTAAHADDHKDGEIEEMIVVGTTPVSGVAINADLIPS